jgi:hypothetical protein
LARLTEHTLPATPLVSSFFLSSGCNDFDIKIIYLSLNISGQKRSALLFILLVCVRSLNICVPPEVERVHLWAFLANELEHSDDLVCLLLLLSRSCCLTLRLYCYVYHYSRTLENKLFISWLIGKYHVIRYVLAFFIIVFLYRCFLYYLPLVHIYSDSYLSNEYKCYL